MEDTRMGPGDRLRVGSRSYGTQVIGCQRKRRPVYKN